MRSTRRLSLFIVLLFATPVVACLWDYDTLRDERRGLPGIAEILAGKWEKHSPFFYEHRVKNMRELIAREPANWAAYDNLAVALEKLDRPAEAIDVMLAKEKLNPNQYTTYANLGTFYIHTGDLDQGIDYIRRALAINPQAHFGREEYQLQLAEFLREGKTNPLVLTSTNFLRIAEGKIVPPEKYEPLTRPTTQSNTKPIVDSFHTWVFRGGSDVGIKPNAIDGIVGIIRFGTGKSAELYLTLGDLLVIKGDKNLAYRAYQRALDFNHPRKEYIDSVMERLRENVHDSDRLLKPEMITAERAEAEAWVKAYQQFEDDLIRAGKDPELEENLVAFYETHGKAVTPVKAEWGDWLPRNRDARAILFVGTLLAASFFSIVVLIWFWLRKRRKRRATGLM